MEDVNRDAQWQPVVVKPLLMQQQNKAMCEESIGKSDDASMLTVSYLTILWFSLKPYMQLGACMLPLMTWVRAGR